VFIQIENSKRMFGPEVDENEIQNCK